MAAKIAFTIEGPKGAISLSAIVAALQDQLKILADVDRGLSGKPTPATQWMVTEANLENSFHFEAESRLLRQDVARDHETRVAKTYRNGLYVIEGEGHSPAYYSDFGLLAARNAFRLIGRPDTGITGYKVQAQDGEPVRIGPRSSINIAQLLLPGKKAIGSVEGRLNVISLAAKRPKMTVYAAITRKGVSCTFENNLLNEVKDALGKNVVVGGTITYNRKGEPQRIMTESFRVLGGNVPTADDVEQAFESLTGSMTTEEYLKLIRER